MKSLLALTAALVLFTLTYESRGQLVEVVFRHSGCASGMDASLIRVSRDGVTASIKADVLDSNTLIFFKTKDSSGTLVVERRWITQAVVVDSLIYVAINRRGKRDSAFASINIKDGSWHYYPNGSGKSGTGRTISCVGENIIGYEQQVGPSLVNPGDGTSTRILPNWEPGRDHSLYEVFGTNLGSVILLDITGAYQATLSSPYLRDIPTDDGAETCGGFGGSWIFNATEIGDSVYWSTSCGTCALSVSTERYRCNRSLETRIKFKPGYGIAGKNGSLYWDSWSIRGKASMTYYSYASTNEVTVRLLDEDDSVATITGGGWWDSRFYVAITVGDCRGTVVYSIDEPEMTSSIEDDTARNARGSGRTSSITLNASTFGSWFQSNAEEAVVYDVHGRLVDHRVVTSGVFLVISSENIHLVAVVD